MGMLRAFMPAAPGRGGRRAIRRSRGPWGRGGRESSLAGVRHLHPNIDPRRATGRLIRRLGLFAYLDAMEHDVGVFMRTLRSMVRKITTVRFVKILNDSASRFEVFEMEFVMPERILGEALHVHEQIHRSI